MRQVMFLERNPTALTLGNWRQALRTPRRVERAPRRRFKPELPVAATQPRSPAGEAPTSPAGDEKPAVNRAVAAAARDGDARRFVRVRRSQLVEVDVQGLRGPRYWAGVDFTRRILTKGTLRVYENVFGKVARRMAMSLQMGDERVVAHMD